MKTSDVDPDKLYARLLRSLGFGLAAAALALGGFLWIRRSPQQDEATPAARGAFRLNEKIWSRLQSSRLSVAKPPPPAGTEPRFNGDLGLEDDVELDGYKVTVESGGRKLNLDVAALRALPQASYSTDFRCIEGWSEVLQYKGTRFSDFMEAYKVGRKQDGTLYRYVGLETPDGGYYVSIDMKSMLHPQTLLTYEENGAPLTDEHGAPVRLVIPIKYGIKSLKRVGRIFFSDERPPDYWAERGYDWYSGL
jgi:DMSO/TMAO reductase YedYZ molybdopterin-dependent catalytic subunit